MKIANINYQGSHTYGFIVNEDIITKSRLESILQISLPDTIEGLILDFDGLQIVKEYISDYEHNEENSNKIPLSETELLAPLSNPPKILCLGLNYSDHAKEQGVSVPKNPPLFMKPRTTINGPYHDIVKPKIVTKLDYECEIAVVIGKKGKNIDVKNAINYIFGYLIFNDVSARDIQFGDKQWTRGKSFDTFAPIGPWITTREEIANPNELEISTIVNGELRQKSSTGNMVVKIPEIIRYLSEVMTLEPGDIISTGTPSGVGLFWKPIPRFLNDGDIVEMSISGLGFLKNKVVL